MNPIKFEAIGGDWVDPPLLMPASLPLELSGEAIRSRLLTTSDAPGDELALRPDLTLAIANHHIQAGDTRPVSYRYLGKAFRQPVSPDEPMEFFQTGFESFGFENRQDRDIATLSVICEEIAAAGLKQVQIRLGNVSIFSRFVAALGLSTYWTEQLNRAFRRKEGIQTLLKEDRNIPRSALASTLAEMPKERAGDLLDEILAMSGGQVIGGRTREDILVRLQSRADAAKAGPMPEHAKALLGELVALEGAPMEVLKSLRTMAQSGGLALDDLLDQITSEFAAFEERKMPFWESARFSISFGRRFEYYDGLVFELHDPRLGGRRPVAAGGRYDGLIKRLSNGKMDMTAVGAVVRPDRIELALGVEGGSQ